MMIENAIKVQGRILSKTDVAFIGSLIQAEPTWSRWRLSREISTRWDWRNGSGQLKDMACRAMLLKLEKQGGILPFPNVAVFPSTACSKQRFRTLNTVKPL